MNIVFMGTPDFAVPSLQALINSKHNVVGVFTQPDKPKGRGGKMSESPIKKLAKINKIQVFQPKKIRTDGIDSLQSLNPDICVTAAFGQILSQEVLDIPKIGTINVHASLLPKHRGAAPVQWAILSGDKITGVTTMLTDKGIDTGDILLQDECNIEEDDTSATLLEKLSVLGANLLIKTIEKIKNNDIVRIKQDENNSTYDAMLKKDMGIIDFNDTAINIERRIRAMQPWPKAFVPLSERINFKILKARIINENSSMKPGTIVSAGLKNGLQIQTKNGILDLLIVQAPNSKAMLSSDYLKGHSLNEGLLLQDELAK